MLPSLESVTLSNAFDGSDPQQPQILSFPDLTEELLKALAPRLRRLDISGNGIPRLILDGRTPNVAYETGIPSEIGRLTELRELHLQHNRLDQQLPTTLGNLSNLRTLNISHNRLTGAVPTELSNLQDLRALLIQGNDLTGDDLGYFCDINSRLQIAIGCDNPPTGCECCSCQPDNN